MKKQTTLVINLFMLILLASCKSSYSSKATPTLAPPNEFTQAYQLLTEELVDSLIETTLLSSLSLNSLLLKVGYLDEGNIVVGIYSEGGTVTGWNANTGSLAFSHELGIVTSKALFLISSGKYLIGATEHNFKFNWSNQQTEYVDGIGLWDVRTGALIKCLTFPCEETPPQQDGFLGLAVDSNGKWLGIFSETGLSLTSVFDDSPSLSIDLGSGASPYVWQIGSIAFDEVNSRYVLVFQEGAIDISTIENPLSYRTLTKGTKGEYEIITEAKIDPTGRLLVVARGNETSVFDLDNGDVLLQIDADNPVLAFDQTGELLFVGARDNLAIYSIGKKSKISDYKTSGITSLAISEDNRLIIWGDTQGKIHIWGKPAQ
jgi:WD40 repeat protein